MKIAVLGPAYPFRGGIAHHTGMLVKNLISEGNEVVLFSFRKQFPKFLFPGKTQFDLSALIDAPPAEPLFIPWGPRSWRNVATSQGSLGSTRLHPSPYPCSGCRSAAQPASR